MLAFCVTRSNWDDLTSVTLNNDGNISVLGTASAGLYGVCSPLGLME